MSTNTIHRVPRHTAEEFNRRIERNTEERVWTLAG